MKEHSRRALHSATVCCLVLCAMALSSVGALAASCRYVKFATLPVSLKSASPTIEGSVNGHAMTVLIDSGSSETTLTRGIAERAGLALAHSNVVSYGVGGESQQYHALVDEVSFGPVRWKRARLPVVWSVTDKSRIDALLGANFLFQNDVEMALAEGQIRFFKPENCGDAFLAYWNADAQVVPMRTLAPDDPRQVIDIEVNGQAVRALIDSGADRSAISVSAAARAGVRVDTGKVGREGQDQRRRSARSRHLDRDLRSHPHRRRGHREHRAGGDGPVGCRASRQQHAGRGGVDGPAARGAARRRLPAFAPRAVRDEPAPLLLLAHRRAGVRDAALSAVKLV